VLIVARDAADPIGFGSRVRACRHGSGSQVSAVVCYDNPYDNVVPMAHHFFSRCLEEGEQSPAPASIPAVP
jgi:hypothetical protein